MRGNPLVRQWPIIRAIETGLNGLTVAEIAKRGEIPVVPIYPDLEAFHSHGQAKEEGTPREIPRVLLSFLDIFSIRWYLFRNVMLPLRSWCREFLETKWHCKA